VLVTLLQVPGSPRGHARVEHVPVELPRAVGLAPPNDHVFAAVGNVALAGRLNDEGVGPQLDGVIADRLASARGPVQVVVPTAGLSIPNVPDGPFWDPEADAGFVDALTGALRPDIPITTNERNVNDPEFGRLVAQRFIDMIQETKT
jgi:uncharacterized protein (UPF0261 family)